jgi:hypothetical protein
MFIAVLFTVAKLRSQPRRPSLDRWIKIMCYIYTREYYSAIKRRKLSFFRKMEGTGDHHVK